MSTAYHDGQGTTDESVGVLVSRASEQVSQLVRQEFQLAQVEMRQKGKRFGIGGGLFTGAGLMAFLALQALVAAAIAAVTVVLPVWAAALVVVGALLLIAGALGIAGRLEMRRAAPAAPRQAIASVKTDVAELKEAAHR
ncbi:phage holin family protein [Streptomyces sulfonofaciens]|uniref:phage holin family protein n=1 Tax=Streptomyces sulfonofaciens TaxID=68272 RepID=UPI001E5C0CE3|nr:phage holin family protein [Streptomyces sulfonofaciens]